MKNKGDASTSQHWEMNLGYSQDYAFIPFYGPAMKLGMPHSVAKQSNTFG